MSDNIAKEDLYLKDQLGVTRFVSAGDRIPANLLADYEKKSSAKAKRPVADKSRRGPAASK